MYGRAGHIELLWSCRDGLQAERLGCVVQVQAAALQVALQLLSGPTPARIPFHDLLGASTTALQSWVDFDGAFMDHPLYANVDAALAGGLARPVAGLLAAGHAGRCPHQDYKGVRMKEVLPALS